MTIWTPDNCEFCVGQELMLLVIHVSLQKRRIQLSNPLLETGVAHYTSRKASQNRSTSHLTEPGKLADNCCCYNALSARESNFFILNHAPVLLFGEFPKLCGDGLSDAAEPFGREHNQRKRG
jgi:hypothetical protein